uniref:Uncharacterized protein n=1 Tax=Astyanax mexicanus TaxID=7994 RepID=A0A3B1IHZ8_ASTMX
MSIYLSHLDWPSPVCFLSLLRFINIYKYGYLYMVVYINKGEFINANSSFVNTPTGQIEPGFVLSFLFSLRQGLPAVHPRVSAHCSLCHRGSRITVEMGFCHVGQAGLETPGLKVDPPTAWPSKVAGITGISHCGPLGLQCQQHQCQYIFFFCIFSRDGVSPCWPDGLESPDLVIQPVISLQEWLGLQCEPPCPAVSWLLSILCLRLNTSCSMYQYFIPSYA